MKQSMTLLATVVSVLLAFTSCNSHAPSNQPLLTFTSSGQPQLAPGETYKSPVFELSDKPARLVYEYKSSAPQVGGVFAVFVVKEGGSSANGDGMPQVITNAGEEKSTQPIEFTPPGRYFLEISALGEWKVAVEQEK